MRASGPTTTTTMLERKESNLQPSASEADALPVAPLPNAGAEGLEPSAHRFKGGRSTVELRPKSNMMDGVRIELTMLASERRGYGPLDHRWSHPVLVAARSSCRARDVHHWYSRCQRTTKKSGRRESNPLLREGVPVPNQWATPACARHEGVEPSTAGFGGPCPYRWGFCRRGLSSAVD